MDVFDANRTKINLLLSVDEHVKLCSLNPGGSLGLFVLDLYTMNVDILLKRVNACLVLAILNPTMLQLLCKVLSLLLDCKEVCLKKLEFGLKLLHVARVGGVT